MSAAQGVSRRRLLGGMGSAGVGLVLAGCTSEPAPPPLPDPDELLRSDAIAREEALLSAYDDAVLSSPAVAARLALLREQHAAHLEALRGPVPSTATPATATTSPSPGAPPPSLATRAPAVPGAAPRREAATLAALVAAESSAGAGHARGALAARDRTLASLLAALSASEQSHPVALA